MNFLNEFGGICFKAPKDNSVLFPAWKPGLSQLGAEEL